mgnify:CR=1 FL=1
MFESAKLAQDNRAGASRLRHLAKLADRCGDAASATCYRFAADACERNVGAHERNAKRDWHQPHWREDAAILSEGGLI